MSHSLLRASHWLTAAALGTTALGVWPFIEPHIFRVKPFEVPALPAGGLSIRILHISDFHLTIGQRRKAQFLRELAQLEPDLVVATGDYVCAESALPLLREALAPLQRFPGVFVMGNNDYYAARPKNPLRYITERGGTSAPASKIRLPSDQIREILSGSGAWTDLDNTEASYLIKGQTLALSGVDDAHLSKARYQGFSQAAPGDIRIGVTHSPYLRILNNFAADDAALILAGHTHGGQLRIPGYGALVTNCDLPTRYARGLHRWPEPPTTDNSPDDLRGSIPEKAIGTYLHVSGGLGQSQYSPYRFACLPQVSYLVLTDQTAVRRV